MRPGCWYLEAAPIDGNRLVVELERLPVTIGRSPDCDVTIASERVSRVHARIEQTEGSGLVLVDLGSTNGTFHNRERVPQRGRIALKDGDILHFGNAELRLKWRGQRAGAPAARPVDIESTQVLGASLPLPEHFESHEKDFLLMLAGGMLRVAWQPIVRADNRETVAYEVLGRCAHPALPQSTVRLFSIAEHLDKEIELSQLFRRIGAHSAARKGPVKLFMNSHPKEMFCKSFYPSIQEIKAIAPEMELVIEVHEWAQVPDEMRTMLERLHALGVGFAYDDFGAGLSRLKEIADIPADVVKFDMSLIRDIDSAGAQKRQMLGKLVQMVADMGSQTLAEGVETEAEAEVCLQMGFDLFQGYLTGRPLIVDA